MIKVKTTRDLFCFGLAWKNDASYEWMVAIIIGCISIEIKWKKDY